ncbi:4-amino-4-deoxy-L-arabinose transferase [Sporobacter termitidis DSM 10068]|uniref:4-amino-4-deoxy-L-arabinose transferase n=1 Tax=Sporobacter termitidis DSM 10068 TaxID=1123282 RepID=A0A1M5YFA5_9FIRM|nr:glycosyltransferase family 39 protein [Sporobacter termitidis]SHI10579.1 4-amino-4-deoxy-L-arabinose transferase [Sporobacter termitidis DSM 10068]
MNRLRKHYDKLILFLILLLTAYLAGYKIWTLGDANAYYTAAVTSMLKSWHNFFFASLDPGGFITVDKPAAGFWLQCLSARIFGVHGWSVVLPEVVCSVVSVAVLFHIVKRSFGKAAGLLAALFLALTPIFIAATRSNNVDASLVMVCLLALWAVVAAAERGSLKHLLLAVSLIGLGFNIKMLQAYFYAPALYLVYFFTAKTGMKKRVGHLLIATAVLIAVSLSWCVAVDLTLASARPYVGSSTTNSALELAIGYNGIARVLGANMSLDAGGAASAVLGGNSGIPNEGGAAGVLRLFNGEMAGQISWLLILAVFGLAMLVLRALSKKETDKKAALRQLLLWLGLFAPMYAFFSISGHFHRYYLIMFAPCLAALSAIAVCELVKRFRRDEETGRPRWQNLLLPAAIVLTAGSQVYYLTNHYPAYSKTLVVIIAIGTALFLAGLVAAKLLKRERGLLVKLAVAAGLLGLLAAPAFWAYGPILYGTSAAIPYAGPLDAYGTGADMRGGGDGFGAPGDGQGQNRGGDDRSGGTDGGAAPERPEAAPDDALDFRDEGSDGSADGGQGSRFGSIPSNVLSAMSRGGFMGAIPDDAVSYMLAHDSGARFLVAVPNAGAAEPLIIDYGVGVMALGGFRGSDNAISLEDFIALVHWGELQYYWAGGNAYSDISQWVEQNGAKVDASAWGGSAGNGVLYDLSSLKTD